MPAPKIETFDLPFDQEFLWFPEWNTLALSPRLDEAGRERALAEWRESVAAEIA